MPNVLHRVVVTGLGCVSPYGVGASSLWQGLTSGRSALRYDSDLGSVVGRVPDYFSGTRSASLSAGEADAERQRLAAIIDEDLITDLKRRRSELSRASEFALIAACEAHCDAQLNLRHHGVFHPHIGVNIGSGISDLCEIFETGKKVDSREWRRVSPFFVPKILTNTPASCVAQRFHLGGGNLSSAVACATGANCIGEAFAHVRDGRWRAAFAGGTESCINEIAIAGFGRMRALARGTDGDISRPFDQSRSGFVLSEGAAVLYLERLDDALQRGVRIYAEILGYGIASDAFHVSAPEPSGIASRLCMQRACDDAGLTVEGAMSATKVTTKTVQDSIDSSPFHSSDAGTPFFVNAHATSTPLGDAAEAASILESPALVNAHVSSFKGHIGHAQAASGAIETAATILAVKNALIPPTLNFESADEKFKALNIVSGKAPRAWRSCHERVSRRIALKNSFGFGGAFVAIAIAQYVP